MTQDILFLEKIPSAASRASIAVQRLARMLRADLNRILTANGELSLADFRICMYLAENGTMTQRELVEFVQMEQGQISRSMANLEERGLITSRRSENDKRARLFTLLDKGRKAYEAVWPVVNSHNTCIEQAIPASDLGHFLEILETMAAASAGSARRLERSEETAA